MRCFRYHSSKNNQSSLHWLYQLRQYTHLAKQSPTPSPFQASAVSRHHSLPTLPAGFSIALHKDLHTSTWLDISGFLFVTLYSSCLAFSLTDVSVPYTRPMGTGFEGSRNGCVTTNPSYPSKCQQIPPKSICFWFLLLRASFWYSE